MVNSWHFSVFLVRRFTILWLNATYNDPFSNWGVLGSITNHVLSEMKIVRIQKSVKQSHLEKSFQAFLFVNAHRFGFLLASPSRKPMESILPGYRIVLVRVKQGNLLKPLPVGLVHTPHGGGRGPSPKKVFKMMNPPRRDRNRYHVPQTNRNTGVSNKPLYTRYFGSCLFDSFDFVFKTYPQRALFLGTPCKLTCMG